MTTDSRPKRSVVTRGTAGRSAAWRRAPGCWRPASRRCSSSSPPTPCSTRRRPTPHLRSATRIDASTGSTPTAACRRTTRSRSSSAARAASHPIPDEFAAALAEVCHDLARQLQGDAEGASHDITIEVRERGIRRRRRRGGPLASPATTSSRPRSSATTRTGAGCSRRSARPTPSSTRTTSTCG